MGLSAVTPVMAGNHGNSPPSGEPCDGLENPSDERESADAGKSKAKDKTGCGE